MGKRKLKLVDRFFEEGWGIVSGLFIALLITFNGAIWHKVIEKWLLQI